MTNVSGYRESVEITNAVRIEDFELVEEDCPAVSHCLMKRHKQYP